MTDSVIHIHLVSDSTGETISGIARACLSQFDNLKFQEHAWSLIRTQRQLTMVLDAIQQWPGMVLYTFVDDKLTKTLSQFCGERAIPHISVLSPILDMMGTYLGQPLVHKPGRQHVLDAEYFDRIDAMDYALALDDGHKAELVAEADVLILGVSRTSKTPTCIYLAHRGIRAANIPLVPGIPLPLDLKSLKKPLIIGLTKDPASLVEIRRSRLKSQDVKEATDYVDVEKVYEEVREARKLFAHIGCHVIDVTRRSIEETAAEIINLLNRRALEQEKNKGIL